MFVGHVVIYSIKLIKNKGSIIDGKYQLKNF